jgi:hypothetical protein
MREETILDAINDLDSISCMIQDIHESIYQDSPDYWTRLEHQYAGMAMQGIIARHNVDFDMVVEWSADLAHALVEKMKQKKRK